MNMNEQVLPQRHKGEEIRPYRIDIAQGELEDLKTRLSLIRWPDDLPSVGWTRGVPVAYLKNLVAYWQTEYNWREHEARINQFPQFTTTIDGQNVHFLHIRSAESNALPLMLIHGWPGSIVEFLDMIGPLTDPVSYGGKPEDAFHLVIPSLPGHGFSGPITESGWTDGKVAEAFVTLMSRLSYEEYGVQGGDVGGFIAPKMGRLVPDKIVGIHVNAFVTFPSKDPVEHEGFTELEQKRLAAFKNWNDDLMGYMHIQGTRPQTLAYGLTDSPVGQLAWIVEKFKEWTDPSTELPEDAVNLDLLLTNVMIYWITNTACSSANSYYERFHDWSAWAPVERSTVPTAVAAFPTDVAIRRFAEKQNKIVQWTDFDRGGHFAAMEAPDLLTADVQTFFRSLR